MTKVDLDYWRKRIKRANKRHVMDMRVAPYTLEAMLDELQTYRDNEQLASLKAQPQVFDEDDT